MVRVVLGCAFLAALLAWPVSPGRAFSPADCATLEFHLKNAAGFDEMRCESSRVGGGGDEAVSTDEFIEAWSKSELILISHGDAGHRTYFMRLNVTDVIESWEVFKSITDWGEERKKKKFRIQTFKGVLENSGAIPCFGFVRYDGHIAGTTGYQHALRGFYCDWLEPASQISEQRIDEMLGAIEIGYD